MNAMQKLRPIAAKRTRLVPQTLPQNPLAVPLTNDRETNRVVPLITTIVTLISHTLITAMCIYLRQESVEIRYGLIGYAISGYAIIVVYGILAVSVSASPSIDVLASDPQHQQGRRSTPLFQDFMLLNVFAWNCVEFVVLELSLNTTHNLGTCQSMISATSTDQTQLSRKADVGSESQREILEAGARCWYALRMVRIMSVCVLVFTCVVLVCTCAVLRILAVVAQNYVWQTRSNPMQSLPTQFERRYEDLDEEKQTTGGELVA
jgi:hypothetical protein